MADVAHPPRVVVVDPDSLTLWSIRTYLQRWFEVEGAETAAGGARRLAERPADALVISDDLPAAQSDTLERQARMQNPKLVVIHLFTDTSPHLPIYSDSRLEKPFALAELARRLGVAERELPQAI